MYVTGSGNVNDNRPDKMGNPDTGQPNQTEYRGWREPRRGWRDERRASRGPWGGLFWGLLLIMIGLIFFAQQQGWLSDETWWHYLLIGLGVVFIIDGLVCYFKPEYRRASLGRFIPGIILVVVGVAFVYNFAQWWPIILIGVGAVILLSFLFRR
jgi:hypothetical protein